MACDLKKNKDAMTEAFEDVRGDSDNDWVVFGYEKDNRTLKVLETGEDGYDEMVEDLGETKAVYAIIKLKDPNSGLPKLLQINWLPDGLPAAVKAVVSRHVTDVERFFPGVHVRLSARYEEDIEEKALLAKISKASGANYSVHKEQKKDYGPVGKTGTNYVKTDATKEVDVGKRNEYHTRTQQEDQRRRDEEQRQKAEVRKTEEAERIEREGREAAARNEKTEAKAREVQAQKALEEEARKQEEERAREEWREQQQEEAERMTAEELQAEAAKREAWEQERERVSGYKTTTMTETDREEAWLAEKERRWEEERESIRDHRANAACCDEEENATRQREAKQAAWEEERERIRDQRASAVCDDDEELAAREQEAKQAAWEEERAQISAQVCGGHAEQDYEEENQDQGYAESQDYEEENQDQGYAESQVSSGTGVSCRVTYDYQAEDDSELSLVPDEIIVDVEQNDEHWWTGSNSEGARGMFPANYVEVL